MHEKSACCSHFNQYTFLRYMLFILQNLKLIIVFYFVCLFKSCKCYTTALIPFCHFHNIYALYVFVFFLHIL